MAYGDTLSKLLGGFEERAEISRAANLKRYAQAMSIYDEIIKRYQPGGTFGKAALGQLETQKVKDVGQQTQQMISSGLYGTTTTAGLPGKWEAEVGAPARLRLEDIMMERLSQAQLGKAGFIERREDEYPDYGMIAQLATQAGQGGGGGTAGGYGGGISRQHRFTGFTEERMARPAGGYWGDGTSTPTTTTRPAAKPSTGFAPYGRRTGPTVEEPQPFTVPEMPVPLRNVLTGEIKKGTKADIKGAWEIAFDLYGIY